MSIPIYTVIQPAFLASYSAQGQFPKAVFDFEKQQYTAHWSVQRNSDAHYFDRAGNLVTVSQNVARRVPNGANDVLLVEPQQTNLYPSGQITYSGMSTTGTTTFGGMSFLNLTGSGTDYIQFNAIDTTTIPVDGALCFSAVIAPGTSTTCAIWLGIGSNGTGRIRYSVDFATQDISLIGNSDSANIGATLDDLGSGLLRISVVSRQISLASPEQARLTAVDGSLGISQVQAEASTFVSSPIPESTSLRAAETLQLAHGSGASLGIATLSDNTTVEWAIDPASTSSLAPIPSALIKKIVAY